MWKVFLSLLIYVNVIYWDNLLYVWVLQNVLLQMQMKFILLWIGGNEWSVIYLILFISDWPDCLLLCTSWFIKPWLDAAAAAKDG